MVYIYVLYELISVDSPNIFDEIISISHMSFCV
jgi:hypothetical protein